MERQPIIVHCQFGTFEVQANRWYSASDGSSTLFYELQASSKAFMAICGPCVCYFKAAGVEKSPD